MPFFKHFGMVTLPDASVDVEDERQPAAQMPYPARQNPVSSWEAVGELVRRYLCHPRGSHHQRLSSGTPGHRQPGLPARRRWRQTGFSPPHATWYRPAAAFPDFSGGLRPGAAGSPGVRGAAAPPEGGGGKGGGCAGRREAAPALRRGRGSGADSPRSPGLRG